MSDPPLTHGVSTRSPYKAQLAHTQHLYPCTLAQQLQRASQTCPSSLCPDDRDCTMFRHPEGSPVHWCLYALHVVVSVRGILFLFLPSRAPTNPCCFVQSPRKVSSAQPSRPAPSHAHTGARFQCPTAWAITVPRCHSIVLHLWLRHLSPHYTLRGKNVFSLHKANVYINVPGTCKQVVAIC